MSTEIEVKSESYSITRFYGGTERGMSYQITTDKGYVQLTRFQTKELVETLVKWFEYERQSEGRS